MTQDRFRRVNELFDLALEKPEAEREAYLLAACGGDRELLDDVLALIDADGASHALLDGVATDSLMPGPALQKGDKVGAYRILEKLGSGGMGDVYLAERADGHFDQKVAVKLIKKGMDTEEVQRRFAAERQILAHLQHPNIAQLFDGGAHSDGRPFYAMEHVEGEPITSYCDRLRLSIDDRLKLFIKPRSTGKVR